MPDFDLLAFYFIDDRAFHHHRYWVHIPGFWLMIAVIALPLTPGRWRLPAAAFFASIFVHIALDSLVGGIVWLWPFSETLYTLITVPDRYDPWIMNFLLHWTFLAIEIPIIVLATVLAWKARRHG